jgi:hypothetical protein
MRPPGTLPAPETGPVNGRLAAGGGVAGQSGCVGRLNQSPAGEEAPSD